ncbi:MAG: hypothetical protein ABMA64_15235 [Myxococcota bacterium]
MGQISMLSWGSTLCGCPRGPDLPAPAEREEAIARIAAYRTFALAPARTPPPSLDVERVEISDGSVRATLWVVRPEAAGWNTWTDGGPRLFNNRGALLFELDVRGPGPLGWLPEGAVLEINDGRTVLGAASSAEVLLGDLLFHALLEERWAIDGDLVARTRGAGPFRGAYLPPVADGPLRGVVAFPLPPGETDLHVVALRLTLPVVAADGDHELVWVIE